MFPTSGYFTIEISRQAFGCQPLLMNLRVAKVNFDHQPTLAPWRPSKDSTTPVITCPFLSRGRSLAQLKPHVDNHQGSAVYFMRFAPPPSANRETRSRWTAAAHV